MLKQPQEEAEETEEQKVVPSLLPQVPPVSKIVSTMATTARHSESGLPAEGIAATSAILMQLAGAYCPLCSHKVLIESDGTWCARCATVLHRHCLTAADDHCPRCARTYDAPEQHFITSKKCPECFRPNDPPRPRCAACRASTRWDSPAAYAAFQTHMQSTSRRKAALGLLELTLGVSFFLLPVLEPLHQDSFQVLLDRLGMFLFFFFPVGMIIFITFVTAMLFIALKLIIKGIRNLVQSRKCSGFE